MTGTPAQDPRYLGRIAEAVSATLAALPADRWAPRPDRSPAAATELHVELDLGPRAVTSTGSGETAPVITRGARRARRHPTRRRGRLTV